MAVDTAPHDEKIVEERIEHGLPTKEHLISGGAREATEAEHEMTLFEALKKYKKAAFWSILISTSVIMEGYDVTLLGSFIAYPSFRKKYGKWTGEEHGYQISSSWQLMFNDLGCLGNIIGAMLNGYLTPKIGHRKVIMGTMVFLTASIFIVFFAPNTSVLLVGECLCSIPWGIFATTGPAYAAEVAPLALRGYLTAYVNLCWAIGQLLSAGVLKGLVNNPTVWGFKIPFAVQWVWPLPLFIAAYFCPESPWFLVRKGKYDEAERSLRRLASPDQRDNHSSTLALMIHTDRLEKKEREGYTFIDAFRGSNLRRTEIACMAFASQVTNGGYLVYNGTFFFEQAGISANAAYGIGLGGTGIAFCGTIIGWYWISRFGRRSIWLAGFYGMVILLYLIAILACPSPQTKALSYTQAALSLCWLGWYSMTVGPIVYTIVSEIGSTRMRTQTVVLARSTYYICNLIGGSLEPKFMSPTAWDAKGKTAFFWGTTSLLTTIWGYFRLPELKDRTFEELDIMFQKKLPSRKFASYQIDREEEFNE